MRKNKMTYHMLRKAREIKNFNSMEKIIKENKFAVIGLCSNNEPYIVTLSYGYDEKNKYLYFRCAKKGQKIDFLKSNPKVCLTILDDKGFIENECEHSYRSVVIKGKMEFVDNENDKINARLARLWFVLVLVLVIVLEIERNTTASTTRTI